MIDKHIANNKTIILAVSYGDYQVMHGGVSRYLMDYTNNLLEKDISIIFFYPKSIKSLSGKILAMKYGCKIDGVDVKGAFDIEGLKEIICDNLNEGKMLKEFHIHHLKDVNLSDIDNVLSAFDIYTRFFVHDYYCVATDYVKGIDYSKLQQSEHFNSYNEFFKRNNISFIAPSNVAADTWSKAFGLSNKISVVPHQSCRAVTMDCNLGKKYGEEIRVAYIGNTNPEKGYDYWIEALGKKADNVSYIEYSNAKSNQMAVLKKGYYESDDLKYMVKNISEDKIDIAVLWSVCRETYSYTFFEALEAGAVILTNKESGNIAAMVDKYNAGKIYEKAELSSILGNYDCLYNFLLEAKRNVSYQVEFNDELMDCINNGKGVTKVCKKTNRRSRRRYLLFSVLYSVYNWLRIKVIKV